MSHPPKKPDFSNVQSSVTSTEKPKADFSNVQSIVTSSEQLIDGAADGVPALTHTVVKGDTLSAIAKLFYGKASQWPAIYEANRDQLDNPDRIKPGQVLRIPPLEDGNR